jgi:hypothetical protein
MHLRTTREQVPIAFTDYLNREWRVARVADIPFPTAVGGNSWDCPLDDVCKRAYQAKGENVTTNEVLAALQSRSGEVRQCWHHRLTRSEHLYVAELSCWFVENEVEPLPERFEPIVKRDGFSIEVQYAVEELFDYPLHWSFVKGGHLGNGRHRLCALKVRSIPRVAVEV